MITLNPISNRDPAGKFTLPSDGWIQIAPKGEFPHPESGLVQVLDDAACTAILNRFAKESSQPNFPGLLIDFDHFSYDTEKSSEAAGWVTRLQERTDGLWGQARWSDVGQQALETGRFRLLSPTWLPKDVEQLGNRRIRPLRLDTAALTNNPNLRGMAPLSNRAGADASADSTQKTKTKNMTRVAQRLGLSAEASPEAILAALTQLENRATAAEAALAPLRNRATELETQNTALLNAQVEGDLDRYQDRIKPEAKEKWRAQLLANRASAIELLDSISPLPAKDGKAKAAAPAPMHNRKATETPAEEAVEKNKADRRARKIANRATDIARERKINYSAAWEAAAGEYKD
jgi:phage I-like protein